jgi:transcription antitermination factor NusA-like protein
LALRLPICNFDAKTGILCAKCESKLKSGEITSADVEASRALIHVAEKISDVNKVALKRAFEVGGNYVLEFEGQDIQTIRSSDSVRAELEGSLKGRVWLIGAGGTERKFLEDMLFPVRVLTVNTVWLPDGGKRTKVIVPGRRSERALGDFEKLRAIVKRVRGIDLVVETEREASYRFD